MIRSDGVISQRVYVQEEKIVLVVQHRHHPIDTPMRIGGRDKDRIRQSQLPVSGLARTLPRQELMETWLVFVRTTADVTTSCRARSRTEVRKVDRHLPVIDSLVGPDEAALAINRRCLAHRRLLRRQRKRRYRCLAVPFGASIRVCVWKNVMRAFSAIKRMGAGPSSSLASGEEN